MKEIGATFNAKIAMALLAEESRQPEGKRRFYDPFALRLVDEEASAVVRLVARVAPNLRPLFIVRQLYLDEQIEVAIQNGALQILIFGSRYETRPIRLQVLREGVKVFEVDHPNDTRWKQETFPQLFGALADRVTYVPFDMAHDDLLECLRRRGYEPGQRSLFICEVVSFMFTADEADRFFRLVASVGKGGSALLFNYVHPSLVSGIDYFLEAKQAVIGSKAVAEPITFGIDPNHIASYLSERGYRAVVNVTAEQLTKRYFGDDRMRIPDYIALATIGKQTERRLEDEDSSSFSSPVAS